MSQIYHISFQLFHLYMFPTFLQIDKSFVFLFQLLHCVETESIGQLLRGGEWGNLMVPLPALADGLRQHQMDVVRLALSLHSQGLV
jgi:hypothetical protein